MFDNDDDDIKKAMPGLPEDDSYLEYGLPEYLQIDLDAWKAQDKKDKQNLERYYYDLYSTINEAQAFEDITTKQAEYLRKKYLSQWWD